ADDRCLQKQQAQPLGVAEDQLDITARQYAELVPGHFQRLEPVRHWKVAGTWRRGPLARVRRGVWRLELRRDPGRVDRIGRRHRHRLARLGVGGRRALEPLLDELAVEGAGPELFVPLGDILLGHAVINLAYPRDPEVCRGLAGRTVINELAAGQ